MNHSESAVYTFCNTLSSKKFSKRKYPIDTPLESRDGLVESLNKIYELCGFNEAEMARRLGVKQPNVYRWRSGKVRPSSAALKHIAATFGISEKDLLAGVVANESSEVYGPAPTQQQKRMQEMFDELKKSGDKEVLDHLDRQMGLLLDLLHRRKSGKPNKNEQD